jgi:hsp70-interacting protein
MAPSGDSGSGGGDPWAWLGLLKWTLAYTDGTQPTSDSMASMSAEDRAFLEKVMKEGIIDENERMKTILKDVTEQMERWKENKTVTQEEEEQVGEWLQELRDIVEQIDYARAFAAMKGLNFLLGSVRQRDVLPVSTRSACLGLLATLCQHNPPVQKELLELESLRILSDLFFVEDDEAGDSDVDGTLRARIMQAISANVRSHELAESVFCQLEQAVPLIERGLGVLRQDGMISWSGRTPAVLRRRTLFFLRALVTSDAASADTVRRFNASVAAVIDHVLVEDDCHGDAELREMALAMVEQLLEQGKSVNVIQNRKLVLVSTGTQRVAALRALPGEEREVAATEIDHWERIIALFARSGATPTAATTTTPPLLTAQPNPNE